jgi:hypothetical protein
MSKEAESLNLRIKQKENDIEKLNGKIMKLDDDISALSDQLKKTKDDNELMRLQKQAEIFQKQADGLREDRRSLETQLSNLKQGTFTNSSSFIEIEPKRRKGDELNLEKLKKLTNWKQNLNSLLQLPTTKVTTIDGDQEIAEIGSFFEFMNREELLVKLYQYLEDRYNNFHIKYTSDVSKKLAFPFPCCFSASGMGKTTIWSKGIEKMLRIVKDRMKPEFYNVLKKCYESKHIFKLDFNLLPKPEDNESHQKYLCMCIVRSLVGEIGDFEFPNDIRLLDLLKFMKEATGNTFYIIQFDETQVLFPKEGSDDWTSTLLYQLSKIIKSAILDQDDIKIVFCLTGLNSIRMGEFELVSGATLRNYELKLLSVDDMIAITNQMIEKFKIHAEKQDNPVYRQFLTVLLGNPRLFSNFLSTCSQYNIETTQSSQEVEFEEVDKPDSLSLHAYIPFSIKGFANFVTKNYFSDKQVLWECMHNLYNHLKRLNYGVIFRNLDKIQNRECFLSLFDMMLNSNLKVERGALLPHTSYTFNDLEKNGYVYLEPYQNGFLIKVPLIVLYHMSTLLKAKNLPHFPIFDLNYKLSWEDNEISDLQWMLVKVWGLGYQKSVFGMKAFVNVPILPLFNLEIYHSITQIQDFSSFSKTSACAFLNGKGSPWADSGLKLKIENSQLNTFEDYVYILIQSKRKEHSNKTENLKSEWTKVYTKELDKFMKEKVLFYLITDGDQILDKEDLCKKYPNIQCITKGQYATHFSQLFETLKSLKSDLECKCSKECKCQHCACKKEGLCGNLCKACKK